jgi:hypothetical protein
MYHALYHVLSLPSSFLKRWSWTLTQLDVWGKITTLKPLFANPGQHQHHKMSNFDRPEPDQHQDKMSHPDIKLHPIKYAFWISIVSNENHPSHSLLSGHQKVAFYLVL